MSSSQPTPRHFSPASGGVILSPSPPERERTTTTSQERLGVPYTPEGRVDVDQVLRNIQDSQRQLDYMDDRARIREDRRNVENIQQGILNGPGIIDLPSNNPSDQVDLFQQPTVATDSDYANAIDLSNLSDILDVDTSEPPQQQSSQESISSRIWRYIPSIPGQNPLLYMPPKTTSTTTGPPNVIAPPNSIPPSQQPSNPFFPSIPSNPPGPPPPNNYNDSYFIEPVPVPILSPLPNLTPIFLAGAALSMGLFGLPFLL